MGFRYRKRTGNTNISWSNKNGARVSKTLKEKGAKTGPSLNIGYDAKSGRITARTRVNFGNGLLWQKQKTLNPKKRGRKSKAQKRREDIFSIVWSSIVLILLAVIYYL